MSWTITSFANFYVDFTDITRALKESKTKELSEAEIENLSVEAQEAESPGAIKYKDFSSAIVH